MGYLLKNRNNLSVTRNHGSCRRINTNTARWGKMTGLNNDINKYHVLDINARHIIVQH